MSKFEEQPRPELVDIQKQYEQVHQEAKDLLGNLYNEKQLDRIMASFTANDPAFKATLEELKTELTAAKTEQEKQSIKEEWLKKNDVLGPVLEGEEEE